MTMDWAVMNSIMAAPNRTCHVTKAPGGHGFGFTLQRQRNMGHSGFHTIGERGDIATGHLRLYYSIICRQGYSWLPRCRCGSPTSRHPWVDQQHQHPYARARAGGRASNEGQRKLRFHNHGEGPY